MNDHDLWQALKNGDKSALESIYKDHVEHLIRYGYRFSQDTQLIEDCLQDLFIELWNKRTGLGSTKNIRPYLMVSLRRKLIKKIKKYQLHQADLEPDTYDFQVDLDIEQLMIQDEHSAEQLNRIKSAFAALSDRQKEAIFLKYYQDMDYEEIGEAMNINYQSVRNLVFRAVKSLRELLFWGFLLYFLDSL
ncbi:MAG: sigma-70 family RNA polymerase sigma factor [Bacteroidota bacterium]